MAIAMITSTDCTRNILTLESTTDNGSILIQLLKGYQCQNL